MIPYASCICFSEERSSSRNKRPWHILAAQEGICLFKGDETFLNKQNDEETSYLSESEICLIQTLKDRCPVTLPVESEGCRQPVITKIIDLSLLDDTYGGVTKILLSRCNRWSFNTFNLDVSTGGRSLSYLLIHLFEEYGFVNHFRLDILKVWHCFNLMEAAYHRHNPYHNSVHAADVTQAMHCFLQEKKFSDHLTPLEAMSSVLAAVAHDLDHPGVTQAFLVATSNHLVHLYNNSSVLENHHWRTAISCLRESGLFNHFDKDAWKTIQMQIRSLILATDITRQKEFLARFKDYLSSNSLNMENTKYRHFALQIALKCADLCNPCRPWTISQRWSYQVCQEFYRQGAYERQLQLPITPTFDCSQTKIAKIQADFFQFVVSPLFETWNNFLKTPFSNMLLENLNHNFNQWQQKITQHERSETINEIPEIKIECVSENSSTERTVPKQHRSKSIGGLHLESYSTEELHPRTTLLSLSSITNTLQLRQVATNVASHLTCPFQPLTESTKNNEKENCSKEEINSTKSRRASDFYPLRRINGKAVSSENKYNIKRAHPSNMCSNKHCFSASCICEANKNCRNDLDCPNHKKGRRGSAPVAFNNDITSNEIRGDLKGGRRWSIPGENSQTNIPTSPNSLLEPLLSVSFYHVKKENNKLNTASDSNLPFPPPQPTGQRRSSLPTNLYHGYEKLPTDSSQLSDSYLLEQTRKHSIPSDILSVLIGPSGMLNTMQCIVSGTTICQIPYLVTPDCSRRRSGGLEMLSGIWKSRTNDLSAGLGLKLRNQLLESTWKEGKRSPAIDAEMSTCSHQLLFQQRRGSVPLTLFSWRTVYGGLQLY